MRRLILLIAILSILFVGGVIWWRNGVQAVNKADTTSKFFVIKPGTPVREIGKSLKDEGLIKDPVVFFLYVKKQGLDKKIQAGDFKLSPSMSLVEVLDLLKHGSLDVWVTIPEGKRAEEVADILKEKIPTYDESWRGELIKNEGYLFPDTYLIPRDGKIDTVISILRGNFFKKVADVGLSENSSNLNHIVTMASLIEREAKTDDEKPLVASVIQNRLDDGMSLDIDATLQYIVGKKNGKWWYPPTGEEKSIQSAYNTYRVVGLPPAPIANPGIESIKAAMSPASSPYYFYIHDKTGKVHFAKTNDEHNKNVAKYLR